MLEAREERVALLSEKPKPSKKKDYKRYIDDAAEHSGDDDSEGEPDDDVDNESLGSLKDFIEDDDHVSYMDSDEECSTAEVSLKAIKKKSGVQSLRKASKRAREDEEESVTAEEAPEAKVSKVQSSLKRPVVATKQEEKGKDKTKGQDTSKTKGQDERKGKNDSKRGDEESASVVGSEAVRVKVLSNKVLPPSAIPPKPSAASRASAAAATSTGKAAASSKPFLFRLTFDDGNLLSKFLKPIEKSVTEMRFLVARTPTFTGLRLETHDSNVHIACRSECECTTLETGVNPATGQPVTDADLKNLSFVVSAGAFKKNLDCALLKDTVLTLTRYADTLDKITFEATQDAEDVHTAYQCALLAKSSLKASIRFKLEMQLHMPIPQHTLSKISVNAHRCNAKFLGFEVYQAADPDDAALLHTKLRVGFAGDESSGMHDIFGSARRSGADAASWTLEVLDAAGKARRAALPMECKCVSEYHNGSMREFLSSADTNTITVHLNTEQSHHPLLMACDMGSKISHVVLIAAREEDA